jgi:hypothetical protein
MLEQDPSLMLRQALRNLRTKSDDRHHGYKHRDYELGFASESQKDMRAWNSGWGVGKENVWPRVVNVPACGCISR